MVFVTEKVTGPIRKNEKSFPTWTTITVSANSVIGATFESVIAMTGIPFFFACSASLIGSMA